jgi:hypothetical protein
MNDIRETFYNLMFEIIPMYDWITVKGLKTSNAVKKALICTTILEIIKLSKNVPNGFRLLNGTILHAGNCPQEFTLFFQQLMQLKNVLAKQPDNITIAIRLKCLSSLDIGNSNYNNPTFSEYLGNINSISENLVIIANTVIQMDMFKNIFSKQVELLETIETKKISEDIIRQTFYNTMVGAALESDIPQEDFENSEAYLFLDLTALTIIDTFVAIKNYNGIPQIDGSILVLDNCPEVYVEILKTLLETKDIICSMNTEQISTLKKLSSSNPDVDVDDKYKTPLLVKVASHVIKIATVVSQRDTFKNIIANVIDFCIN